MSPLRKDPIPNQEKTITILNKYQCLTPGVHPFIPGNKRSRNEENDDNPENTDTSQSKKYDTSHTSRDDSFAKAKGKTILTMMTNKKRILRKFKTVMNVLKMPKLQILCVTKVLSIQRKKKKH